MIKLNLNKNKEYKMKKITSILLTALLIISLIQIPVSAENETTLTFSNEGIEETVPGTGYTIIGTALNINAGGVYKVTGSCAEGSITVAKSLNGVTLIIEDLMLACSTTAPVVIKKSTTATIVVRGSSTITDGEDPLTEATNELYEGAAIKIKSSANVTFTGDGSLNAIGTAKNGIKGGAETTLTFDGGSYTVDAVNSCISCDHYIEFNGGDFSLTSDDDGIVAEPDPDDLNSCGDVVLSGGTFTIDAASTAIRSTGSVTVGRQYDGYERDPEITVLSSQEGIESKTVNIHSGKTYIIASDDGINASSAAVSYGIEVYVTGGDLFINATGDGIDSNGNLDFLGGNITVFSGAAGGNEAPFEADGNWFLGGATVFGAGTDAEQEIPNGGNQPYFIDRTFRFESTIIRMDDSNGNHPNFHEALPRDIDYIFYSYPNMVPANINVTECFEVESCNSDAWAHNWDAGVETTQATVDSTGIMTYTCQDCGATELKTIPALIAQEIVVPPEPVYTATFEVEHATINVYYTQDYTAPDEVNVLTAIARDSATGESCGTGDGQINFTVVPETGYSVSGVTATAGTYKNIKGPADTGVPNTYRLTKVSADTTITITTVQCSHSAVQAGTTPTWDWEVNLSAATLSYVCADCGETVNVDANMTSVLTDPSTITFTATAWIGNDTLTDTRTAAPYVATFVCDAGVEAVYVYYTQNYAAPDEANAQTAVARDSDTGGPVVSGDGQVNFAVILKEGCTLVSVDATGSYKNKKDIAANTGIVPSYRLTKITGAVTVTITTEGTPILRGDVNMDGVITSKDGRALKQYFAGLLGDDDISLVNADVDCDGDITSKDFRALKQLLVA